MTRRTRRTLRRGFTLFELLTVLAVLSVVTTVGATAFVKMATVWGDTSASMELNATCVDIFNTIRDDVERIASARRTGRTIQGVDRLETEKLIYRHIPQDDSIILPIHQRERRNGPWQELAVMYRINREGIPSLVRTVGPADGQTPESGAQTIGENVIAMNITYLDHNNTWSDEWSRPELPSAIRVSLSVGLPNRPDRHVARETVFPIHVK